MFDDIFDGSPKEKCFEIIFGANPSVVSTQLDELFTELAHLRLLAEQMEDKISPNLSELENAKNDLYIELVSNILSNNE